MRGPERVSINQQGGGFLPGDVHVAVVRGLRRTTRLRIMPLMFAMLRTLPKTFRRAALCSMFTLLAGCATGLQPVEAPLEMTPPPATGLHWKYLETVRRDDWFHLLNTGREALDWRLRAIDSAVDSIDLQTFIWDLDGSGELIRQHLLDAASRGVFVRVLVDDSFILDADEALLAIDEHPGIELKVFNPYKRRSSAAGLRQTCRPA